MGELPLGGNGSAAENISCCVSCHLPSGFNFKSIICQWGLQALQDSFAYLSVVSEFNFWEGISDMTQLTSLWLLFRFCTTRTLLVKCGRYTNSNPPWKSVVEKEMVRFYVMVKYHTQVMTTSLLALLSNWQAVTFGVQGAAWWGEALADSLSSWNKRWLRAPSVKYPQDVIHGFRMLFYFFSNYGNQEEIRISGFSVWFSNWK